MNELIDTKPDINVLDAEYKRLLGYPQGYELGGRSLELAEWARDWFNKNGRPWIYAVRINDVDFSNERFRINGVEFSSKRLCSQLKEADACSVMLAAVSAGSECEEMAAYFWQENKPDRYFFLEIFGSAVVENLITNTGARFCAWADENNLAVLPHYSPGYPGWDVTDQNKLMKLIKQEKSHSLPGTIEVLDTGMLKPKKSLLALFGITKSVEKVKNLSELIPCETCSLQGCRYRRTNYKHSRNPIEDVSKLQPGVSANLTKHKLALNENAKYNLSLKALQKWSTERLKLRILKDNSIEAQFRYEGTTCSNMGHPLEFDYFIKLSPAEDYYKIISMNCNPVPGDSGYKYMCEYINDPELIMNNIKNEKPLIGKELNNVLSWKYQFSPEGCYCKANSREHKWGLVLEVLHYALVQFENSTKKLSQLIVS